MKHYHIYTNQCRILENAFHKVHAFFDKPSDEVICDRQRLDVILAQCQCLCDCYVSDDLWLQTALKREDSEEDFSLVLGELIEEVSHLSKLNLSTSNWLAEINTLLPFLQSARDNLRSAAAQDHGNLLAQLKQMIKEPSNQYREHDVELARFSQGVLSADTQEAEKKARQISAEDLVYSNTLAEGGNTKVDTTSWKGVGGFSEKENRVRQNHDKPVDAMSGIRHPNGMHKIGCSSVEPSSEEGMNECNVPLTEWTQGDLDGFSSQLSKQGLWKRRMDILLLVSRVLTQLHQNERKIVHHRDLKPANILLDKLPAVDALEKFPSRKQTNFGCSREL